MEVTNVNRLKKVSLKCKRILLESNSTNIGLEIIFDDGLCGDVKLHIPIRGEIPPFELGEEMIFIREEAK